MFTKQYPEPGSVKIIKVKNPFSEYTHYNHIRIKLNNLTTSLLLTDKELAKGFHRTNIYMDEIQDQVEKKEVLSGSAYLLMYSICITIAFITTLFYIRNNV